MAKNLKILYNIYFKENICDALRGSVPFIQFKKREKHPKASHITDFYFRINGIYNRFMVTRNVILKNHFVIFSNENSHIRFNFGKVQP